MPNEKDPEKPKINTDCGFSWGIDQAQLEPSRHDPQQDGPIGFSPHQHRRKLDPTVKDGPGGYKPPSNQILASPAD